MKINKNEFISSQKYANLTTGETIRMLRTLKGWTQEELAARSGINAKNISMLENDKVKIGKRRAVQLAKAYGIHPAIIMFPEYEADLITNTA